MAKASPFGKVARTKIINQHFREDSPVTARNAWKFVYRELLWIDGSTGLAHLYESDKAQPGRSKWYERTILFTDLLCEKLGEITRDELKQGIDRLFRSCLELLLESKADADIEETAQAVVETGEDEGMPEEVVEKAEADLPAFIADVELTVELEQLLIDRGNLAEPLAKSLAGELVSRARYYYTVGRKRQNVLGEGFEDVLHTLATKVAKVPEKLIIIRQRANTLPGFGKDAARDRIEAPDMAIVVGKRTDLLATIKWSLRQDRQKQLSDEIDGYVDLLSQSKFPRYALITNEFDPGRLINTAGLSRRGQPIDCIYHISLDVLLAVLDDHPKVVELRELIDKGRLRSLEMFLNELAKKYAKG